jgi:hypothetical protein
MLARIANTVNTVPKTVVFAESVENSGEFKFHNPFKSPPADNVLQ